MKRRDALALLCLAVMLVGIGGAFGVWMALIVAGSVGLSVVVALTVIDLRGKPDGA